MLWNTSKLTIIIANTSKHTSEMSNARSLVANPTASTESKILDVTSLAVTRMPQRNVGGISVDSQDANSPRLDSQERIIVKDTCDSVITLPSNYQEGSAEADLLWRTNRRNSKTPLLNSLGPWFKSWLQDETNYFHEIRDYRAISAMNWTDRCSPEWRLYNSEQPHGDCRFSEPSMELSNTGGVQPWKLIIKDWRNAHGKVGYHWLSLSTTGPKKRRKQWRQQCRLRRR